MRAGRSTKSINNYLTILRRMLSVAQEWDILAAVPKAKCRRTGHVASELTDFGLVSHPYLTAH